MPCWTIDLSKSNFGPSTRQWLINAGARLTLYCIVFIAQTMSCTYLRLTLRMSLLYVSLFLWFVNKLMLRLLRRENPLAQ